MTVTFLCESLKKIFAGDPRPIDWAMLVIELLVLAIIAYEAIHAAIDRFRIARRKKVLLQLMNDGHLIFQSVPHLSQGGMAGEWNQEAEEWMRESESVLSKYSPQAVGTFNLTGPSVANFNNIAPGTIANYRAMIAKLENLRGIMEKPEIYY